MAQIVHYRRELAVAQKGIFSLNDIYSAEKELLAEKLEACIKSNAVYEGDMNARLALF